MKLMREQPMAADNNTVNNTLKLIKASEKWVKAMPDKLKKIEQ
jgi:hypothetical protein